MANYNDIINITKSIIGFTSINQINYNINNAINQTNKEACSTIYKMFNNTNTVPTYKSLIDMLYVSINNMYNCNFTKTNVNDKIVIKQIRSNNLYISYETIVIIIIGLIMGKVISVYFIGNKNMKYKYT